VRPSRAKQKTGWTRRELAKLTGISMRTIRLYLEKHVLPRPPFRGPATRFQRQHLLWLLAIRRLRATEKLELAAIRTRLQTLSAPDIEAFATRDLPPGVLTNALGVQSVARPSATTPPTDRAGVSLDATAPARDGGNALAVPRWARVELALGLELHVREDASAHVLDLVRRIRALSSR
jgi:Ca-activated chloride channel family protein